MVWPCAWESLHFVKRFDGNSVERVGRDGTSE
jgi:hypothetical protein